MLHIFRYALLVLFFFFLFAALFPPLLIFANALKHSAAQNCAWQPIKLLTLPVQQQEYSQMIEAN